MRKSSVNRGVLQTTSAGAAFWYIDMALSRQFCDAGFEILYAQQILEQYSCVEGKIHRFLLVLRKQK